MELVLVPQEVTPCIHCTRPAIVEETQDGLCIRCVQYLADHASVCMGCQSEFLQEFTGNGDEITQYTECPECAVFCERCGERCENGDTITAYDWNPDRGRYDSQEVCANCLDAEYRRCDDCSEYANADSTTVVHRGRICQTCIENYNSCDVCGAYVHQDNCRYAENGDTYYCENCYTDTDRETAQIHSSSYSPLVRFFGTDGTSIGISLSSEYLARDIYHGIELECGYRVGDCSEYAERVIDALGDDVCYLKEDGSITSETGMYGGFEIVTQPCTLEWYRRNLPNICNGKIPGLLSHNADNAGLGLHISVNKSALTNHAIARICAFIGAARNETWLVKLARRQSSQWAQIIPKNTVEDTLEIVDGREYLKHTDKYEAVNLQHRYHVEFRLFRGTLNFSSAMLCLEFVNALCRWSMVAAEVSEYQSAHSLLEFAKSEPEVYPHLIAFLCANI